MDGALDMSSPIREQFSHENPPEYDKATTDLEGDDAAGAKTGEMQGPRVLGFEQILAGDFSADKSVGVADSDTQPAAVPAEFPLDAGGPTLTIALAARVLAR